MDLLKERIMQEGRCFPGGILKVDSFVNHQMDPILMMDLAKEFVRLFQDIKYNKIITIEASGIAPAIMVGYLTLLPVVFVKKKQPKTMEGMITSVVHSFTKDRDYTVCVSDSYLTPDDHVIFIDDFLANGNASKGVMELCEKAGAKIEAMGFIIEKAFQHGGDFLRREGMRYEALATVESLEDCKIVLKYGAQVSQVVYVRAEGPKALSPWLLWTQAVRPEGAEALSPGQRPGYNDNQKGAL